MKENFNNQFATQKLRENEDKVKFTIDDGSLYSAIMDKYMRGQSLSNMEIQDDGDYLYTDEATFNDLQIIASDLGKKDALIRYYKDPKTGKYVKVQELDEEGSVTGPGEAYLPSLNVPKDKYKGPEEAEDRETKLAEGPAKIYPVKKWGWKKAPSIPNRPSKGGFEYESFWEELNENYSRFKNETKTRSKSQQMHEAVKLAEKKIAEANRILEYTSQLRTELFEGGETKYSKHTGMVMERMVKRVAEAYKKIKSLK